MGDWLVTDLAPKFGALGMRRADIMVLNFAVWVNVADEYAGNLAMWADYYRRHKAALPFVLWRDASVQHFDTPTGAPSLALFLAHAFIVRAVGTVTLCDKPSTLHIPHYTARCGPGHAAPEVGAPQEAWQTMGSGALLTKPMLFIWMVSVCMRKGQQCAAAAAISAAPDQALWRACRRLQVRRLP